MAITYRQEFLASMRALDADLTLFFRTMSDRAGAVLLRAQNTEGAISPADGQRVRNEVATAVTEAFVKRGYGGYLTPFDVRGGTVVPLSSFMVILWRYVETMTRLVVEQHASIMRRALQNAPDVRAMMEAATVNPFAYVQRQQRVHEFPDPYTPRPFLEYDPFHRFVDARGYTLSTKIWDTAQATRRKIDLYLANGIAQGTGAQAMARELEQFLWPGRKLKRTRMPYGTDASYDAMRLARTEITAAHSRAGRISAAANPFVTGADWVRSSARRPCTSGVCDALEAGSPYTLEELPDIPGDSHPHCMCYYRWHTENVADVVASLRGQLQSMRAGLPMTRPVKWLNVITPLAAYKFVSLLLGEPEEQAEYL